MGEWSQVGLQDLLRSPPTPAVLGFCVCSEPTAVHPGLHGAAAGGAVSAPPAGDLSQIKHRQSILEKGSHLSDVVGGCSSQGHPQLPAGEAMPPGCDARASLPGCPGSCRTGRCITQHCGAALHSIPCVWALCPAPSLFLLLTIRTTKRGRMRLHGSTALQRLMHGPQSDAGQ